MWSIMWSILFGIAEVILVFITPFAGFAVLDILNCIRENKEFWFMSKIIVVAFIWALGWTVVHCAEIAGY